MDKNSPEFIMLVTEAQSPVYAYILSLFPDRSRARDLLQETNLTLWKKAADFEEGTNFNAWACKIAYFHVLAFRRKLARDKLVFDDQLLDYLAERQEERDSAAPDRNAALQKCLAKLPDHHRKLVEARYEPGASVQGIAAELGRSVGSISQTLYRIRNTLLTCIERTLATERTAT